jgi:cytoskeletal protein CcmA (bactofilin family)
LIGDCTAKNRIEIQATGKLTGNIRAPKIVIAEGAMFKGSSDMSSRRAT